MTTVLNTLNKKGFLILSPSWRDNERESSRL